MTYLQDISAPTFSEAEMMDAVRRLQDGEDIRRIADEMRCTNIQIRSWQKKYGNQTSKKAMKSAKKKTEVFKDLKSLEVVKDKVESKPAPVPRNLISKENREWACQELHNGANNQEIADLLGIPVKLTYNWMGKWRKANNIKPPHIGRKPGSKNKSTFARSKESPKPKPLPAIEEITVTPTPRPKPVFETSPKTIKVSSETDKDQEIRELKIVVGKLVMENMRLKGEI